MGSEHKHYAITEYDMERPIPLLASQHIGEVIGGTEADLLELEQDPSAVYLALMMAKQREAMIDHRIRTELIKKLREEGGESADIKEPWHDRQAQELATANEALHDAIEHFRQTLQNRSDP